ncbi:MAG: HEAT repeat domain-containing protein [Planctomycetota bacterium]|jgi:HEAT repeat protein|nr:HEAT repeat domain-containing protein [Planctomycetota bacterium]
MTTNLHITTQTTSTVMLALFLTAHTGAIAGQENEKPNPKQVQLTLNELQSGDWLIKWEAMQKLSQWEVAEAVQPILAILKGKEHPWVRGRALVALSVLQGKSVLPTALNAFKTQNPLPLRIAAVEALGLIGSPKGEEAIRKAIGENNAEMRFHALAALAKWNQKHAWVAAKTGLASQDTGVRNASTRALVFIQTPEAKQQLIDLLGSSDAQVQLEAVRSLRKTLDPNAIPALLHLRVNYRDRSTYLECERALSAYKDEALKQPLLDAMQDKNPKMYQLALKLLARQPTREVCDELAPYARKPGKQFASVLPALLEVLALRSPGRYQDIFSSHLENPDRAARLKAIDCLSRCPEANLFSLLKGNLSATDNAVRQAAFKALQSSSAELPKEGIVQYLAPLLKPNNPGLYKPAIDLLAKRITAGKLDEALEGLAPFLSSADASQRTIAATTLDRVADQSGKARIAAAQGYVTHWMVIGSFPLVRTGEGAGYPPEREINFKKKYQAEKDREVQWFPWTVETTTGKTPLHDLLFPPPTDNKVAFCAAALESSAEQKVQFHLYTDDGFVLWLNKSKIGEQSGAGKYRLEGKLTKGKNQILVRVDNRRDWWWLQLRVTDRNGRRAGMKNAQP